MRKTYTNSIFLILLITFFSLQSIYGQQQNGTETLSKINLFESTRLDVEKVFRYSKSKETAKSDGTQTVYYDLDNGRLSVDYSIGKCSEHQSLDGYNIEENVVIGIYLYLFKEVEISKFNFNLDKFEKITNPDTNGINYLNENLGIEISGDEKTIRSIEFSPSISQESKFGCSYLK